jgi:hypothetical protein
MQWREEDEARSKFRLGIILRLQNRPKEADALQRDAFGIRKELRGQAKVWEGREYTDRDDMELFDKEVTIWHGRTSGIWSNGDMW